MSKSPSFNEKPITELTNSSQPLNPNSPIKSKEASEVSGYSLIIFILVLFLIFAIILYQIKSFYDEIDRRVFKPFFKLTKPMYSFYCQKFFANRGKRIAQFNLAVCYEKGEGTRQDSTKAFEWYQKAAFQGHTEAQFNLALYYQKGKRTIQDLSKAFEWYQKAALQGHIEAQYNLAACYEKGEGIPQDLTKAVELYQKIINNSTVEKEFLKTLAHFSLSKIYKGSNFKNSDLKQAEFHLKAITENKDVDVNYLQEINEISEENREKVILVIQKVAYEELIDLKRHEAKEQANMEMLSFLTHTLNNSLGSVKEGVNLIIKELGTNYETDSHKFEAVLRMLSLANIFSVTGNLVHTFKQVLSEPAEFQKNWKEDNKGTSSIISVIAIAIQQTTNRLFFELHNSHLTKFFPLLTEEDCDKLRQQFIKEIILTNSNITNCFDWLKINFNIISLDYTNDNIKFDENGKRFTFLFSIISELLYNAIRYASDKPVQINWFQENDYYCFSCKNYFNPRMRHKNTGNKKGLSFIKRLITLLNKSELTHNEQDNLFTVTLKLHKENFA